MLEIKDLKKRDRESLRLNEAVRKIIRRDHGTIPAYFEKCCERDYKVSNGKVVKRIKARK